MKAVEEEKEKMHTADEEVKKERHCSSIARRWWIKAKIAETKLIFDKDLRRKAEAKIDDEKNSEQKETEWQIVRKQRKNED